MASHYVVKTSTPMPVPVVQKRPSLSKESKFMRMIGLKPTPSNPLRFVRIPRHIQNISRHCDKVKAPGFQLDDQHMTKIQRHVETSVNPQRRNKTLAMANPSIEKVQSQVVRSRLADTLIHYDPTLRRLTYRGFEMHSISVLVGSDKKLYFIDSSTHSDLLLATKKNSKLVFDLDKNEIRSNSMSE